MIPSRHDLLGLLQSSASHCVSIVFSTNPKGLDDQQPPIRLKNLLNEAESKLVERGMRAPEARALLEPAWILHRDGTFWLKRDRGLALFLDEHGMKQFDLPYEPEQSLTVNCRFAVKPLVPAIADDGRFYILALSQNNNRLLRGSRYHIQELRTEELPQSLAEALNIDENQTQFQFRQRVPQMTGAGNQQVAHGHGEDAHDSKDELRRYFNRVAKSLQEYLRMETAPLILAAVDYYFPIYRDANTYAHLLDEGICGNPEGMGNQELGAKAVEILEPYFEQRRRDALAKYRQGIGMGRASDKPQEILPAAHGGRVESLFIARNVDLPGQFDPISGSVQLQEQQATGVEDLVEMAAMQTLTNNGDVFVVGTDEPDLVASDHPMAAVFRY